MLRRFRMLPALAAAVFAGTTAAQAAPDDTPKPLPIGSAAPAFSLPGVDGKTHSLNDFASARVLVVLFTCNHCPTAQAYEARVARFHADYKDRGVALVAISPNDAAAVRLDELGYTDLDDSLEAMKIRARDHKYTYPYLYDGETQAVSKAFGVLATPHVFVFDAGRKLVYAGRWDDAEVKKPVKSPDLLNAVNALLDGKPVPVATTRPFGCSTKWSDKRQSAVESLAKWDKEPVKLDTIDDAGVAKLVKNDTPDLLVVNLWATWCGPCVEELPAFVEMHRMYRKRKFRFITISLDEPDKADEALKVLKESHASNLNYLLRTSNRDRFAEALDKEWPGPLPYTLIVAPGGKVLYRKSGAIEPLEVKRAIVSFLGRTY